MPAKEKLAEKKLPEKKLVEKRVEVLLEVGSEEIPA